MNTPDEPLLDDNEWAAQERGMRVARTGDVAGVDAVTASYGVVARTLDSASRSEPPKGFPGDVARRIIRQEAHAERLSRVLLSAFVLVSIVVGVEYGGQCWQLLQQAFGDAAPGWLLAVAACVTLSWIGKQLLDLARLAGNGGHFAGKVR